MYSFTDIQFWFYALLFLPVIGLIFVAPGYALLRRITMTSPLLRLLLSFVLGLVLWAVQGYLLGYLHLRFLTYGYVAFWLYYALSRRTLLWNLLKDALVELKELDKVVLTLLGSGLVLQMLPMVASGMRFSDGIRFYFVNEADGIMHLSYIESLIRSFPPQEPGAVGLPLVNYHYWSDLVIAELSRIFTFPIPHLFFQFFPMLISVVTGLLIYFIIREWKGSTLTARFALFLLYFSGDAAYLVYGVLHHSLSFHTPALDNGITQFFNMPHAFAKMIFLAGLISLHRFIKTKNKKWGVVTIAFFAPLVGFKVYYGLFAALGFSLVVATLYITSLITLLKKRVSIASIWQAVIVNKTAIMLLVGFAVISSLIYFPTNFGSGGLIFSPLEWPKLLLGEQALNFREWWLRMQVYEQAGNTRNVLIFNTLALCIALISIHGTRLLGFIPEKRLVGQLGISGVMFYWPGILLFTFLGFFTLQESGLFNIFNFFVVTLVVLSLFAAFSLSSLYEQKKWWGRLLVVLFIVATVPRVLFETGSFVSAYKDGHYRLISNDEIEALIYLREKTRPTSVIQSHPENPLDSITPYVSYFSNRSTYFTGGGLLATHNQPVEKREKELAAIFSAPNVTDFAAQLREAGIQYVYLHKNNDEQLPFKDEPPHVTKVFENNTILIYQIFKESQ